MLSLLQLPALFALLVAISGHVIPRSGGSVDASKYVVAAVRQPPVNFALPVGLNKTWVDLDLNATVAQASATLSQAAKAGVNFIAFPELYFPGYPVAINTAYTPGQIKQYVSQSMRKDGPEWKTLTAAIATAGVTATFGFSELTDNAIYMGQALVAPNGTTLLSRRKLRPSGVERNIWSDGDISGLQVVPTDYGRVGMLECWEHFHPTMTFAMLAQKENIHVAGFPYSADYGVDPLFWESAEVNIAAARAYATNSYALTLMPSIGKALIFGAGGLTLNESDATTALDDMPYITATVNTTAFGSSTYDINGEQSWGTLLQTLSGFPNYIPRIMGTFTDPVTNNLSTIQSIIVE